jgi:hypothetical protein
MEMKKIAVDSSIIIQQILEFTSCMNSTFGKSCVTDAFGGSMNENEPYSRPRGIQLVIKKVERKNILDFLIYDKNFEKQVEHKIIIIFNKLYIEGRIMIDRCNTSGTILIDIIKLAKEDCGFSIDIVPIEK